ncbi:MAG: arginine deiminase [Mycoplasmataceae bacterium]|nr:arginine deiminase [Mycoplasmataceae bacterium]
MKLNVTSEYGILKKVLLHRPGAETENLTPDTYEELLFDDAYFLKKAQEEHDVFASVLKKEGVEVVYLEDLITETISISEEIKKLFIEQFIYEAKIDKKSKLFPVVVKYLNSFKDNKEMIIKIMAGVRFSELNNNGIKSLSEISTNKLFVLDPMPNLIFTRDPFSTIGKGISLHTMYYETRKRETLFAYYIFKFHPEYKETTQYYNRDRSSSIEGGDVMILTKDTIAVGISQRTQAQSIEKLSESLFQKQENIKTIYAVDIPKGRSWMHLDTVFTQIDKNKFSIFSNYKFDIFKLTKNDNKIKIEKYTKGIDKVMTDVFGVNAQLIHCGNGDPLISEREQWNDGSNVLAIRPNTVITYERNYVTNQALRDAGVKVIEIPSGELSRGRGGPRCMSMPLIREEV